MTKIVNIELKTLMPIGLNEIQQKLWRFLFNMLRRKDLAQPNPISGAAVAIECIERLKKTNPEDFPVWDFEKKHETEWENLSKHKTEWTNLPKHETEWENEEKN